MREPPGLRRSQVPGDRVAVAGLLRQRERSGIETVEHESGTDPGLRHASGSLLPARLQIQRAPSVAPLLYARGGVLAAPLSLANSDGLTNARDAPFAAA